MKNLVVLFADWNVTGAGDLCANVLAKQANSNFIDPWTNFLEGLLVVLVARVLSLVSGEGFFRIKQEQPELISKP